jgi:peptide subunit release factor 1 (eRF1)
LGTIAEFQKLLFTNRDILAFSEGDASYALGAGTMKTLLVSEGPVKRESADRQ